MLWNGHVLMFIYIYIYIYMPIIIEEINNTLTLANYSAGLKNIIAFK